MRYLMMRKMGRDMFCNTHLCRGVFRPYDFASVHELGYVLSFVDYEKIGCTETTQDVQRRVRNSRTVEARSSSIELPRTQIEDTVSTTYIEGTVSYDVAEAGAKKVVHHLMLLTSNTST
jgi:hypothetical protein